MAFVGQQVCIFCALSSKSLLADALVQDCQVSSARERQLLLTNVSYSHAQGVFSSVKGNPAADKQLPAGRQNKHLYIIKKDLSCRWATPGC